VKQPRATFYLGAACCVFVVAGCQPSTRTTENPEVSRATNPILGALQANHAGKAWNHGLRAARSGDTESLAVSAGELRRLGATSEADLLTSAAAERQVRDAINLDTQALQAPGARKQQLQQQANRRYRAALRLAPDLQSRDPLVLNALGYFLADRGTSSADYVQAES
jgi:hypothetical protein